LAVAARLRLAAGVIAVAVALGFVFAPMSAKSGFSCDGIGGPVRWLTGGGNAARHDQAQRQADMNKGHCCIEDGQHRSRGWG
jgi:hypothetical protein